MNISTLPDMSRSLKIVSLINDLREKADENTLMGWAIISLIEKNKSGEAIIKMIKEQTVDNPALMKTIIGEELVERIMQLEDKE